MRVFTTVPQQDLRRVPAAARAAEAEGYDGIISMENQHDPFLALAVAGVATEKVELHTGVAISFPYPDGSGRSRLGSRRLDRRALRHRDRLAGSRPQRAALFGAVDTA